MILDSERAFERDVKGFDVCYDRVEMYRDQTIGAVTPGYNGLKFIGGIVTILAMLFDMLVNEGVI